FLPTATYTENGCSIQQAEQNRHRVCFESVTAESSRAEYHVVVLGTSLPAMTRRRGNPNWGRPGGTVPAIVTEFEREVRRLRLTRETCSDSGELRRWCECNRNRWYIPEWLLEEWEIAVETNLSGAALSTGQPSP